jgi:cadmium resistance protein CadD (predicted permease)
VHAVASTWQTATTAVGLFAGTNIDDIVVLSALNVSRTAVGRPSSRDIWGGQYLGMAVLVAVSLLASRGLNLVNSDWVGLLGIIPLSLGSHPSTVGVSGLPGVVALTAANGGDNIAAYTPVFGTQSNTEIWLTITTFAVCVAVWCLLGAALVTHRRVVAGVQSWGHWIVPVVYLAIGLWVLQKAGYL